MKNLAVQKARHYLLFFSAFVVLTFCLPLHLLAQVNPEQTLKKYPGGRDEEDLKVQENPRNPIPGVDRKTVEEKVLKNYLKKADSSAPDVTKQKK